MPAPSPAARPLIKPPPTHRFAPGSRILARDEEWIVRTARQTRFGATSVQVTGISELVRGHDAVFLSDLDELVELKPEETLLVQDPSPQYRRSRLYLESLLRQSPPTEPHLVMGHLGAMDVKEYQLVPAARALQQPRARILIADAVGLGKTIETGILLSELIARGRGRRILVVALKSVLEQFQEELWARFTIPLVRLDSVGIERVRRNIPANMNPFQKFDRVIISVDTLKKDAKYRRFLEACHWDVTVIDECQHVAVRGASATAGKTPSKAALKAGMSQRARLAKLLARTCDSLILTSATPHDGKPESFASLINLLEPTAVANESDYTADEIRGLYVRRFKKDIAAEAGDAFSERKVHAHHIPATPAEDAVLEGLRTAQFKTLRARGAGHGVLFRTTLLKGYLSSPEALGSSIAERTKRVDLRAQRQDDEGEASSPHAMQPEYLAHDRALLHELAALTKQSPSPKSGKFQKLVALLKDFGVGDAARDERVVIFSERIQTLEMLERELRKATGVPKDAIGTFHGSLDDQQQQALVKDFGTQRSPLRVLLCSDAASEGINLHYHCHRMVHYDIPWSLITLEQRNGRIDRFGQHHTPDIHYLFTRPSSEALKGDLRILEVLTEKEHRAHKNLGDVQWLMNLHDPVAEADRVAAAISQHEDPDSFIRDPDKLASGEGADTDDDSDDDLAAFLKTLSDGERKLKGAPAEHVKTATPFSVYDSSLGFVRDALEELKTAATAGAEVPATTWHAEAQGLTLTAPADLQRRLELMPPELRRDGEFRFKLTSSRALVQQALTDSRKDPSRWPEWQLLWQQHPVMEWLNDRVLAHFGRHEAPVLRVHDGLQAGEAAFVFQAILSNQESQPMVLDWLAVRFADTSQHTPEALQKHPPTVEPFEPLAQAAKLHLQLSNAGKALDTSRLLLLRGAAVAAATRHMQAVRKERGKALLPTIKAEQQRVAAWAARVTSTLAQQDQALSERGQKPDSPQRLAIAARVEDVERELTDRKRWVEERFTTGAEPYLRLALVLKGAR
ncbi:MAG: DEAD/DEAH box helicase [Sandaracinaceae bacterium]|nr:DEAD/DEAH box helicase [Sandaracinaceae bacterium]